MGGDVRFYMPGMDNSVLSRVANALTLRKAASYERWTHVQVHTPNLAETTSQLAACLFLVSVQKVELEHSYLTFKDHTVSWGND